jgi:chorismate mutase
MSLRGIRGATVVEQDTASEIVAETRQLLAEILSRNAIQIEDIASIFFTVTADLTSEFPAVAARELGLNTTPLICMTEIPVPKSLPKCIRVLLHVNTELAQTQMNHVYLKAAEALRPDHKEKA